MNFLLAVFWIALGLIVYTYAIFPGLIFLRGHFFPAHYRKEPVRPTVSLVLAVHNEEEDIPAKLENVQNIDYPGEKLEVIIASDGSTDRTNEILQQSQTKQIKALLLPRIGKAGALNTAVANSQGEILVFSDANSIFAADAVQKLVEPFADPAVGGVAGNQCYYSGKSANMSQAGEKKYWNFDRLLKIQESQAGNVISATGSIYAIRRDLFQPIIEDVTDDFYTSTAVIEQGYRLVFAPAAVSFEPVAADENREFRRKVRIMTRGLRAVIARRGLLNPFHHGFYAVQLFSHKVLRRLVVFPLLALFVASLFLAWTNVFYTLAAASQVAFYGTALVGYLLRRRRTRFAKLAALPFYFTLVNAAALMAVNNILRGEKISRWEPQRAHSLAGEGLDQAPLPNKH